MRCSASRRAAARTPGWTGICTATSSSRTWPRPARRGPRGRSPGNIHNPVDGHDVPVPHFGLILTIPQFQQLADRLRAADIEFVIEPYVRFEGKTGEQWTMFLLDPAGNALEFKAFADDSQVFAA